jgi:hypothetical protein
VALKRPTTTIKVSRKTMRYIEANSKPWESVDDFLKRDLKLVKVDTAKPFPPPSLTTTIKVSRTVMDHIIESSKPDESRDRTLSRLLKIEQDDGNVKTKEKAKA